MILYTPQCGVDYVHEPHLFDCSYTAQSFCAGYTAQDKSAVDLVKRLETLAGDLRLIPKEDRPKLVLECHPSVLHSLGKVVMPNFAELYQPVTALIGVEVRVTAELPRGERRVVIASGKVPV